MFHFTGALFMFGQTKRTGEANMYPKPVQDLTGMITLDLIFSLLAFLLYLL